MPIGGVALIAHLADDLIIVRGFFQRSDLPDVVGERLFHIDVFSRLHRGHGRGKVRVIGRGNHHGVDLLAHFIEHDAQILEALGFRILLIGFRRGLIAHIAQSDDIFIRTGLHINAAPPADAIRGDINFRVGRLAGPANTEARQKKGRSRGRRRCLS